jgi:hypothetical protein
VACGVRHSAALMRSQLAPVPGKGVKAVWCAGEYQPPGRQPNPDAFLSDLLGVCAPLMPGASAGGTYMALLKAADLLAA